MTYTSQSNRSTWEHHLPSEVDNTSFSVFHKGVPYAIIMKPISEIEENLASKAEPILGFKPSSKIKRGPIGILISIICIAIVYRELSRAGVI